MKILMSYMILLMSLLGYWLFKPTDLEDYFLIEAPNKYETYVDSLGYDGKLPYIASDLLSHYETDSYVTSLKNVDFIWDSSLPYTYSRDWSRYENIDWDGKPTFSLEGHLFKSRENTYYLLFTYNYNHTALGHLVHHFELNVSETLGYEYKTHLGQLTYRNKLYGSRIIYGEKETFPTPITNSPHKSNFEGVILYEINEIPNNFLQLRFNVYEQQDVLSTVRLGFNSFTNRKKPFIPQSLELTYFLEDN
ncbi:hypothetical protein BN85315390 [Paracholeplasma brassicae]|uniref:Uncharacterized protein n=1 Tax=Acholeplasma brassicae TaxID=61635 RepID=U4KQ57_9MOLU|nr:hypothetical protein [Paracholeplasma brassicae]CCV66560.1 hypothetical protein BN85315390 [Paracholeplasma brassicae]